MPGLIKTPHNRDDPSKQRCFLTHGSTYSLDFSAARISDLRIEGVMGFGLWGVVRGLRASGIQGV